MGYDFSALKKGTEDFYLGAFSWPVLLEAFGYLFPCVSGSGMYCSAGGKAREWTQLVSNDNFKISSADAKLMARCARNYVAIQRSLPAGHQGWPTKIREDFVDKFEAFADWAEKSGGFRIG